MRDEVEATGTNTPVSVAETDQNSSRSTVRIMLPLHSRINASAIICKFDERATLRRLLPLMLMVGTIVDETMLVLIAWLQAFKKLHKVSAIEMADDSGKSCRSLTGMLAWPDVHTVAEFK